MTMFQRKRIKAIQEEVESQYAAVETRADGLLEKLKESKWTVPILLGAVVFAIAVLWGLS